MRTRTKIICTMGPAVNTLEKIKELMQAGMTVARLNLSHGTHDEHKQVIELLKLAREQLALPLAIMLDTKGPEIRLGKIGEPALQLTKGHRWTLVKEPIVGDTQRVFVNPPSVLEQLKVGMTVLFDNGYISSKVVEINLEGVVVEIQNAGLVSSSKGVNVPNANLGLPAVTPQDIKDIKFGCENDIDVIAASFVRCAEHVATIKKLLEAQSKPEVRVLAKIENAEGVDNFDEILQISDGIMIARGDLGVEIPLSQVPILQKKMIRKCHIAGKPSVTATQMLESMINNPRPTRAETSDIANAVYDSTSAVMLSGETAVGKYPVEAVHIMRTIVEEAERDFQYRVYFDQHFDQHVKVVYHDVPSSIALAAVKTAYSSHAKAIFAFTETGSTVRLLARLRPEIPIIALTPSKKCFHQLALDWGTVPLYTPTSKNIQDAFKTICRLALEKGFVAYGDLVVVTAGFPFGVSGTTNMMMVETIKPDKEITYRGNTY